MNTKSVSVSIAMICVACNPASAATYDCLIEPMQSVEIRSQTAGLLDKTLVRRGDRVTKDQIIATLDSRVEQAATEVAKHKAQMTGPLKVAQSKFEFAKRTFERRRDMQAKNLMSGQEKEDAERDMKAAEAELLLAQENQRLAELEYQEQAQVLERRTIRSPLNGVVVDQLAKAGEMVEPTDSKDPVFKLAQLDPLRVHVIMPRNTFGTVKRGATVEIQPELPARTTLKGTVMIVDSLVDAASGTYSVFLEIPNPKLANPAGFKCKATL